SDAGSSIPVLQLQLSNPLIHTAHPTCRRSVSPSTDTVLRICLGESEYVQFALAETEQLRAANLSDSAVSSVFNILLRPDDHARRREPVLGVRRIGLIAARFQHCQIDPVRPIRNRLELAAGSPHGGSIPHEPEEGRRRAVTGEEAFDVGEAGRYAGYDVDD